MKRLIIILFILPLFVHATNYTYSTGGGSNILIDSNTFGTSLKAGDTVFIPPYTSAGWRSQYLEHLRGGNAFPGIVIYWEAGAYINPNLGGQIQANGLEDCIGVKITGVRPTMNDNEDVFFRVNTGTYSSWIWIDNWNFNYQQGLIQIASTLPNMAGDSTKCFHDWKLTRLHYDTTVNELGGTFIAMGSITADGYWRNVEIANDTFEKGYSVSGVPSTYIEFENVYNINLHDCITDSLGVVASPTGHAASFVLECVSGRFHHNRFMPGNFGNDMRFLGTGNVYAFNDTLTTQVYDNLTAFKRKYPFMEWRDVSSADSTTDLPYLKSRHTVYCTNNTCFSMQTGGVYLTAIFDCYASSWFTDSPYVHNNILCEMPLDTWNGANGPFVISNTTAGLMHPDSAHNLLVQFFANAGLVDSVHFYPVYNNLLSTGVAAVPYPSTDVYGNPMATSGSVYIGAVQYVAPANKPYIIIQIGKTLVIISH